MLLRTLDWVVVNSKHYAELHVFACTLIQNASLHTVRQKYIPVYAMLQCFLMAQGFLLAIVLFQSSLSVLGNVQHFVLKCSYMYMVW